MAAQLLRYLVLRNCSSSDGMSGSSFFVVGLERSGLRRGVFCSTPVFSRGRSLTKWPRAASGNGTAFPAGFLRVTSLDNMLVFWPAELLGFVFSSLLSAAAFRGEPGAFRGEQNALVLRGTLVLSDTATSRSLLCTEWELNFMPDTGFLGLRWRSGNAPKAARPPVFGESFCSSTCDGTKVGGFRGSSLVTMNLLELDVLGRILSFSASGRAGERVSTAVPLPLATYFESCRDAAAGDHGFFAGDIRESGDIRLATRTAFLSTDVSLPTTGVSAPRGALGRSRAFFRAEPSLVRGEPLTAVCIFGWPIKAFFKTTGEGLRSVTEKFT